MSVVYDLILAAHLLGMAAIVGGFFVVLREPRSIPAFRYGAATQLVTGLALVGIRQSGALPDAGPLNNAAVGVKLLIALVVTVLAWLQRANTEKAPTGMIHAIGGLAIVNVLVAALWL
ncbi:MAG TPA: hypothetical protein VI248_19165 [Kineosporiaceae bacterium]